MNRMFYFWRQLRYDMNDRYAFFLKETKCVVSVLLSSELQTYGGLRLMKAKRNYFKMVRSGAFWHSRVEWYCHHKSLHIRVGWKGFHQDIKPKDIRVNSSQGPGSEWILGQAGCVCQTSFSDNIIFTSICLSPVLLLNSTLIQFISALLGKVKFNNVNLYRKVYEYSWKLMNYWQNQIEATLIMVKGN